MRLYLMMCLALCSAQALEVSLIQVRAGFSRPVGVGHAGDSSGRLFVVLQEGRIVSFRPAEDQNTVFLDIRDRVSSTGERGLLGLAFPPGFANKRHFYVNYTDSVGDTVVARFRLSDDPEVADPSSEEVVLRIAQPFSNHNGGQLQFGPDGYLYVGTGDGGSARDPMNNAQNGSSLLGKILRIDVESGGEPYVVPADNPFLGNPNVRPEIWALGLRNPWRFSFDRETGDLWIGDVGQNRAEEINFQPAASQGGENYGWKTMEGLECLSPPCSMEGLTLPILEYGRNLGVSVTGGYVYRGSGSPGLRGSYLYADFGTGRLWGVRPTPRNWQNSLLLQTGLAVSSFGEDESGELYLLDYGAGNVYRLAASGAADPAAVVNAASYEAGLVPGSASTVFVSGILDELRIVAAAELPLPRQLEDVSVLVDGLPAPLYALGRTNGTEQVNFQCPFEIAGRPTATVTIVRDNLFETSVAVPVFNQLPGLFTLDGVNALVVHHADNSLVSPANPLRSGELAYFYVTGLQPPSNGPGTGLPAAAGSLVPSPELPVVSVGGVPCQVLFAGLAPGFVGVYQVNIRVADSVPSGSAAMTISQNGSLSPAARVPVD